MRPGCASPRFWRTRRVCQAFLNLMPSLCVHFSPRQALFARGASSYLVLLPVFSLLLCARPPCLLACPPSRDSPHLSLALTLPQTGSSQGVIEKYILTNFPQLSYKRYVLRQAIKNGLEKGVIVSAPFHKNSYKLGAAAKEAAKKAAKAAKKATTPKAPKVRPPVSCVRIVPSGCACTTLPPPSGAPPLISFCVCVYATAGPQG